MCTRHSRPERIARITLFLLGGMAVLPATGAAGSADEAPGDAPSLVLDLKYHIEDNLAEQDVFLEHKAGTGEVFRVTKYDRDMDAPIYATAQPVRHNPFDAGTEGPYPMGRPLGLTLGQWFGADGKVTYTCEDGAGTMDVELTGLVPDGVYTLWHFFMAMPPTKPFTGTYDLPVGDRDGTQSVFRADDKGEAHFRRVFQPCLQLSGEHLAAGVAVAWHSDGRTWGVEPGPFGTASHVQLYAFLPPRPGL
jgi:hypothetical protein